MEVVDFKIVTIGGAFDFEEGTVQFVQLGRRVSCPWTEAWIRFSITLQDDTSTRTHRQRFESG